MKYISVVILLGLLAWTYSLSSTERDFSLESYKLVEAGVEKDIREFIQKRYPTTSDIFCQQMYSENVKTGEELITHFRCSSEGKLGADETVEQVFEGHIRLRSDDGFVSWSEVGGEIRARDLRFQSGTRVSTKDPLPPEAEGDSQDNEKAE